MDNIQQTSFAAKSPRPTPYALRFALFFFLFSIYMLSYTPRINSSDGLAMFATAESLVRWGTVDIEQIRWMGLQQGSYGLDGLLYSRKGIGVPVGLLPLTWLGLVIPWFGTVSVSLLFNALLTALTAMLLLAYLQILGFSARTGLIVALTFGLATLAWPYAKSLFSDPFSGFLLLATAYILLKWHKRLSSTPAYDNLSTSPPAMPSRSLANLGQQLLPLSYPFLAGLLLGWNVATRYAEALFLPIYGLLLLYYLYHQNPAQPQHTPSPKPHTLRPMPYTLRTNLPPLIAFTLPILLIGLSLIIFNLKRYGSACDTGYLPNETFSGILWQGIWGQLVSPGRGLLIYCPILLLTWRGLAPFLRRFPAEGILALSIIIIHLLLYGKWFMWHGGYAWGPRFMIPTLPFWCLFLAPLVMQTFPSKDKNLQPDHSSQLQEVNHWRLKTRRITFGALFFLSLIPQLLSVSIDFAPFQDSLLDSGLPLFAPQTFFEFQYAALIGAWQFIKVDTLDLSWIWAGELNGWLLAILLTNVFFTGFCLRRLGGDWEIGRLGDRQSFRYMLLLCGSTSIALISLLLQAHTLPDQALQGTVTMLNETARPSDAIIINNLEISMPFAELYKGQAPVLGLNQGGFPLPERVSNRLQTTIEAHEQIWWLPNWLPAHESAIEQTLLTTGFRTREERFEEQRLLLFAHPAQLASADSLPETHFDNLMRLVKVAYPAQATAKAALPIELEWQATASLSEDYHIFIHLLDQQGQLISQTDGQPVQWSRPTSTWGLGETIIDRHGLWIPAKTPAGTYQLSIGVYQPADKQRLHLSNGEDSLRLEVKIKEVN